MTTAAGKPIPADAWWTIMEIMTMSELSRRNFLAATTGTATCLGALRHTAQAATASVAPSPPPQVPLGNTGITLSRVGQGTGMRGGNRQSDHTRLGFERLVHLLRHAYDRGITFFDMADLYGTHVYFREALRHIPRENVAILTKMWWRYDGPPSSLSAAAHKKMAATAIERFRHEIATDYLDIVLLHCMTKPDWDQELGPYMEALADAKEKKQVRAVGVSCHNLGAMKTAARCPWIDVVLARINPRGVKMDGTRDEVIAVLRSIKDNGKAVIGMKIFGEGQLAKDPKQRDQCIHFAQNLGLLDCMTIGFEKPGEIDETLGMVSKYPAAKVRTSQL